MTELIFILLFIFGCIVLLNAILETIKIFKKDYENRSKFKSIQKHITLSFLNEYIGNRFIKTSCPITGDRTIFNDRKSISLRRANILRINSNLRR